MITAFSQIWANMATAAQAQIDAVKASRLRQVIAGGIIVLLLIYFFGRRH